jgi:hypothetical protein
MTIMGNNSMTMAEFAQLLDVYGGERTRWPAEARAAAAQLVAVDPAARRLLAESEALDRILSRAPLPGLPIEAELADRIVAAAQRSPRIVRLPGVQRTAEAAPAEAPAPVEGVTAHPTVRQLPVTAVDAGPTKPWHVLSRPMAAGVLAASLVLGVLIGNLSTVSHQLLPALAEVIGFTDRDDLVRIALSEEVML